MTPLAIAIIWACFVSAVAIGAVWDIYRDYYIQKRFSQFYYDQMQIIFKVSEDIENRLRANPLTRHVLQGRDDKGRFVK